MPHDTNDLSFWVLIAAFIIGILETSLVLFAPTAAANRGVRAWAFSRALGPSLKPPLPDERWRIAHAELVPAGENTFAIRERRFATFATYPEVVRGSVRFDAGMTKVVVVARLNVWPLLAIWGALLSREIAIVGIALLVLAVGVWTQMWLYDKVLEGLVDASQRT